MNSKISESFFRLIILQAIHSAEEFIFKFYERFPPMRRLYGEAPHLARPAFLISNLLLILAGLLCFHLVVRTARKGASTVVWIWVVVESFNVIAHLAWALLIRGYNPGLVTGILLVPVLARLSYLMWRAPSYGESV